VADADKPEVVRPADDVSCRLEQGSPWDGITSYITTDLVLWSTGDLTALAAALEARGLNVRDRARWIDATEWFRIAEPQWYWTFKAEPYDDPEPEVAALLAAVEALDPPARAAWAGCSQRVFDLGYDCGTRPFSVRHDLSARTLARLAAAGGLLRITLYVLDPSKFSPAEPVAAADPARTSAPVTPSPHGGPGS
jgi:hypothetical protein